MSAVRVVESSGSLGSIQISDGSGGFLSGSISAGTNVTISNNGSGGFTINANGGGGAGSGTIGAAEDGNYEDGLFIDFDASTTAIGTAIDRFNEILKALAPSPAPVLSDLNTGNSGLDAKLSFGSSNDQTSATPAYHSVLGTAGFGAAVDAGSTYARANLGNNKEGNKRLGIFTNQTKTDITGHLNDHVQFNSQGGGHQNFPANAFGDADQGTIFLDVNGVNVASADLTDSSVGVGVAGSGTDDTRVNSNGSGFLNLSAPTDGKFSNGNAFATFKHRTGEFIVRQADQRQGWNYAQVRHVIGTATRTTSFIEWVNDTSTDGITAAGNSLSFVGSGSIHLSGVEYFQSGTLTYKTRINNAYKYIYRDSDTINFTTSGVSGFTFSNLTKGSTGLAFASNDTQDKILHLTASDAITPTTHLNGSATARVSVQHPDSDKVLTNGGTSSASGILIYNRTPAASPLFEDFNGEAYRIQSGSYDNQNDVTHNNFKWDSEVFITASNGGHSNGLQVYDGRLRAPTQTLNGGNFSSFANGPSGNPDYSGQNNANNIRTYYRYFTNTDGLQHDISVDIDGSGTIVAASSALSNTNIHVFVKVPGSAIGWMDVGSAFVLGQTGDGAGAHTFNDHISFTSGLNNGDNKNYLNFGNASIANNEYLVLKIVAKETWTGNVDDITVDFGAGEGTVHAVPNLTNIGSDNNGATANLSFDDGKIIGSYVPVSTTAGGSDVNINGKYEPTGNRRGVFAKNQILTGHLNSTVDITSPNVGHSYENHSFSDANVGSLILKVNGIVKHQVEITGSQSLVGNGFPDTGTPPGSGVNGTSLNPNGSGFIKLSQWVPGKFSENGVPRYSEIFRTAKYQINPADQVDGFNYAQVIHDLNDGSTPRETNYIEWVNDSAGATDDIAFTNLEAKKFGDNAFFHLSGVKYFISPTGSFGVTVDELYTNVYSDADDAIRIDNHAGIVGDAVDSIIQKGSGVTDATETGSNITTLALLIDNANTEQQLLHVTASCAVSHTKSLRGAFVADDADYKDRSATLNFKFKHPLKNASGKATSNVSATNFLIYTSSDNSTHTHERFTGEQYRIISGTYGTEASTTNSANAWNSTYSMNDSTYASHQNGLMIFDEKLISPSKGGDSGNFRNKHEASSPGPFEGPDNNVDYRANALTKDVREYFRYFVNPTTSDLSGLKITLTGDAEFKSSKSGLSIFGALGANKNFYMDIKIPGQNEFMDCARQYVGGAGQTSGREGDGCRDGALVSTITNSGVTHDINLDQAGIKGTGSSGGPDPIIIRIRAHKNWTGFLSQIQITWSAT